MHKMTPAELAVQIAVIAGSVGVLAFSLWYIITIL